MTGSITVFVLSAPQLLFHRPFSNNNKNMLMAYFHSVDLVKNILPPVQLLFARKQEYFYSLCQNIAAEVGMLTIK